MNIKLFLILILIESLFVVGGFFSLGLFFFLHYGSGASASSENAIQSENIAIIFLILLPILFGLYKYLTLLKTEKQKAKSYIYAGLLISIFSGIYFSKFIY